MTSSIVSIQEHLDTAEVLFVAFDLKGNVTFINKKGCKILGVPENEVVGSNWFERFIPDHQREKVKSTFATLTNGHANPVTRFENTIRTAEGSERVILWQNIVLENEEGAKVGVLSSGVDITNQKEFTNGSGETSQPKPGHYDNLPIGVYRTTPDGHILYVNSALLEMLGFSSLEELSTRDLEKTGYEDPDDREKFKRLMERDGEVKGFETTWVRRDGEKLYVRENANACRDDNGKILFYEGTVEDVTEVKENFKQSLEDHDLLQALMDNIPDTIYFKDLESRFVRINDAQVDLLGIENEEEAIGKTDFDFFPEYHAQAAWNDERRIIETGEPVISREEEIRMGGECLWLTSTKVPIRDSEGNITGLVGISRDITEQKRLENEIQRSEEKYRSVVENMLDGLCIIQDGKIRFANQALGSILGMSEQEIMGRDFTDFIAPEDEDLVYDRYLRRQRGESVESEYEFSLLRADSTRAVVHIRSTAISLYDQTATVVSLRDVSEQKKAEKVRAAIYRISEAAHTSSTLDELYVYIHEILQGLMPAKNMHIALYDEETGVVNFPYYVDEYAPTPEPRENGKGLVEYVIRNDTPLLASEQDIKHLIESGDIHLSGNSVITDWLGVPLRKDDKIIGVLAVQNYTGTFHYSNRDKEILSFVSDQVAMTVMRKQIQSALAAERERLAVTLRSIGDGVISTDIDGNVLFMNKMAERLTGWEQSEAKMQPLSEVFPLTHAKNGDPVNPDIEGVMKSNTVRSLPKEVKLTDRNNNERYIADSIAPLRDEESKVIGSVIVFQDVTQQRQLEEEALKARKLESIGILAGGIAHDFNNILSGILGNISLAKLNINEQEKAEALLGEAETASKRAAKLTKQLLTFSKGGAPVKEEVSMKQLINESIEFALRGSNVREKMNLQDGLWTVEVDPGQIDQVLQNLIFNANQAMPEGGIVLIRAENILIDSAQSISGLKQGNYVKIEIEDHGVGIPEEHLDRIFDPYFTTKDSGHGLGLSTCYSIIQKHGGHIAVDSTPEEGTTMSIYLPASSEANTSEAVPKKVIRQNPGAGVRDEKGRILVMDDDKTVQEVAEKMLRRLGYAVKLVEDGDAALKAYRTANETGEPFDAVILDLTIPGGMGGKTTIKKLLDYDQNVCGIVSSGYSTDPILASHREYGFAGKVSKPYDITELERTVSSVLES